MSEGYKCYECGEELTEEYWACYYASEYDECNILCGSGECWADWMQDNTHSHTIERDTE
jgi:uncharacterized CHY-type Zn-finger protein